MKYLILSVLCLLTIYVRAQPGKGALQQSVARGKVVYNQVCNSCHQADGGGVPNMNPPLIKSKWVTGDKKILIGILLHGFSQKVAIDGDYYSNNMPAQSNLTDLQIADVLTFVRNNFGNKASAILPAQVKLARSAKK